MDAKSNYDRENNPKVQEFAKIDWSKIKFIARPDTWYVAGTIATCEFDYGEPRISDRVEDNCGMFHGYTNEIYKGFEGELPRPDEEGCTFEEFDIFYGETLVNDISYSSLLGLLKVTELIQAKLNQSEEELQEKVDVKEEPKPDAPDERYLEPKEGMEYLYRLSMVWKPNTFSKSFPIEINTIVVDVKKIGGSHYQFKNKETQELLECHYPWALAEHTPENLQRILEFQKSDAEYERLEKIRLDLAKKIVTLLGDQDYKT